MDWHFWLQILGLLMAGALVVPAAFRLREAPRRRLQYLAIWLGLILIAGLVISLAV